jgi:pimeloyl-ACP methyl ester carboxylesterase
MALVHPDRVRSLISCMGLPATASPLRSLTYLKFGIFPKLMRLKPATSRDEEVDNLVAIFRAIASPGFPFPQEWACEVAGRSYDRSPRDPRSTQRQLAAGRDHKLPPLPGITAPTLVISGADDPLVKVTGMHPRRDGDPPRRRSDPRGRHVAQNRLKRHAPGKSAQRPRNVRATWWANGSLAKVQ